MSVINFWTAAKGNLPHLSRIFHNPEPLGRESNNVACYVSGYFIFIYLYRRKEGMKNIKYHMDLGST